MAVLDRIPALYYPTMLWDIIETLRAYGGYIPDVEMLVTYNYVVTTSLIAYTPLIGIFQPEANINMWSLRKPYFNNKIGVLENSEAQMAGKPIDGDEGTTTCRYGLSIAGGLGVTPLALYNHVGKNGAISYHLPEGGELSPYRLSDFCGYDPKASMPISGAWQGTQTRIQGEAVALDYFENINQSDGSMTFEDLYGSTTGWRKAAILVEENPEDPLRPVRDVQIGEISSVFTGLYPNKTFTVVQFITTLPQGKAVPALGNANGWKDYVQYAIPNGTFTLEIEKQEGGGGGSGNDPAYGGFFVAFTETPSFAGPVSDPYGYIKVSLSITSAGESTINALSVYVYSDRNYTNEIKRVSLIEGSFELYGTRTYRELIENSVNATVWVRIVVNGTPKIGSVVDMPFNEID